MMDISDYLPDNHCLGHCLLPLQIRVALMAELISRKDAEVDAADGRAPFLCVDDVPLHFPFVQRLAAQFLLGRVKRSLS